MAYIYVKLVFMIIAIDTGGTKTLIANFNESSEPISQIKFPTPQDPNEYINVLRKNLEENFSDQKIDSIVIAVPGTLDDDDSIIWAPNLQQWTNFNVIKALEGVLGVTNISIENDANLAGLYEARIINPIPEQVLYVTISTGIGTGIITNGHINPALRNSEGGRSLIEFNGELQEWQNFASGKAFYETYGRFVRDITDEETLNEMIERMSLGFIKIIPTLQPDVIVIGGSVGTYFERYGDKLAKVLAEKLPKHITCPKFIGAINSEEAVIYGCYYYALDKKFTSQT
jgi:predicted NBD/HSP70 family sugar kinase